LIVSMRLSNNIFNNYYSVWKIVLEIFSLIYFLRDNFHKSTLEIVLIILI